MTHTFLPNKINRFLNLKKTRQFIIWFYIIGAAGFVIPYTHEIFKILIPYALLLNLVLIFIFHKPSLSLQSILVFFSIFLLGFTIEVIGVQTGDIFGIYQYGKGLGLQLMDVPLLIGLNWLMLVYCTAIILNKFSIHVILKIIASSLLMIMYDIVLEQLAAPLDMWYWQDNVIPFQNYISWFFISVVMHGIFRITKSENSISSHVFFAQFGFFIFLYLFI